MSFTALFSRLSLKGKTMAAILLVVGAMELLSGLWLTVSDARTVRKELIESSTLNASLVAEGFETRHFEVRMIRSSTDEVLAIVRDITEGRNAAAQITQMQKMETVWTLAGGLAHDFNNILTGILGPASMIEADLASGLPLDAGEVKESVRAISASARRASQVVRQLLHMSRRQDAAIMAAMDLRVSLKHVRSVCASSLDKSVSINFAIPDGPASIVGDPPQIEQMLLNLCVNAAHAMTIMRPGGGAARRRVARDG